MNLKGCVEFFEENPSCSAESFQVRLHASQRTGAQLKKFSGFRVIFPKWKFGYRCNEQNFQILKKWVYWHLRFLSGRVPGTRCQSSAGAQAPVARVLPPSLYSKNSFFLSSMLEKLHPLRWSLWKLSSVAFSFVIGPKKISSYVLVFTGESEKLSAFDILR